MKHKYKIIAHVRRVGAIGIFYDMEFILRSWGRLDSHTEFVEEWQAVFSDQWELHHLVSYIEVTEEAS